MTRAREPSRHELLVEAFAAVDILLDLSSSGDRRRYDDDRLFRYAMSFGLLRLTEPLCRLVTKRMVGDERRQTWGGMCDTRNMLAHERAHDIDFDALWLLTFSILDPTDAQLDLLMQGQ